MTVEGTQNNKCGKNGQYFEDGTGKTELKKSYRRRKLPKYQTKSIGRRKGMCCSCKARVFAGTWGSGFEEEET